MLNSEDYMKIFHEIKNSVTLINSYMQLVQKRHSEITDFDYWSDSVSEVSRLRSIVTELSQIKLGNGLKQETIDMRAFISDVCESFRGVGGGESIIFRETHPPESPMVFVDTMQLRHAVSNIIKNSCEAMGYTGILYVDTGMNENQVFIKITDSGGGLMPEVANHIFDPFITTKEDGSGLGLIISQQIVEAHNGYIEYDSRVGDGCTFFIFLPRLK